MDTPSVSEIDTTPYGPGFKVVLDAQYKLRLAFRHFDNAEKAQAILRTIFGMATHVEVERCS